MNDFLTWGAIIGALGSIIVTIKFWMEMGKAVAEAASAREDVKSLREEIKAANSEGNAARTTAAMVAGKHDLLIADMNRLRVEIATNYVSHPQLMASEQRYNDSIDKIQTELTKMNDRLYQILDRVNVKT